MGEPSTSLIIGVCGVCCSLCPIFRRKERKCYGCEYFNKRMAELGKERCPIYTCAKRKGIKYCFTCDEFPCRVHYEYGLYGKEALDAWRALKEHGMP